MESTHTTSRGLIYNYIHAKSNPPANKPYLLFLHGFPSIAHEWHHQIEYFTKLGYGVIAPDLLGYGKTSRSVNLDDYRLKAISQDVVDILDHEDISDPVFGVGHDWGVTLLSRMEFYHPQRFAKLAFLTIGCSPLGQRFDLDTVNSMCEKMLGHALFGYIEFFTRDPNAVEIINSHLESMISIIYAQDPSLWKTHFGSIRGLKEWLLHDQRTAIGSWFEEKVDRAIHKETFTANGGYAAPLLWYHGLVNNISVADECAHGCEGYQLRKPLLMLLASNDPIAIPGAQLDMTRQYAPELTVKELPTGHWVMLEAKDAVNKELRDFFEKLA
ncbi:hypothetical protein ABEF95_004121 [Exophiala dermatitidis]